MVKIVNIPSRIEWKHFSHFSRIKTFSLPDSDIRALIAGSIQGTSVSLRLLKTSDKTSIAAPEIRELKNFKTKISANSLPNIVTMVNNEVRKFDCSRLY